jgi:hypothetical protein
MRIVRPGMIVGPQQRYMLRNQMKWVAWVSLLFLPSGKAAEIRRRGTRRSGRCSR